MKQATSKQLIFILEIKLQKVHFSEKYYIFSAKCANFEPLLGRKSPYVCHNIRTENKSIYRKESEYQTSNWHASDFHLGN